MEIIGHQKQWQFLKKSAEVGKLSHAYLFCGQEKLGKKTLALEFVKWLFKEDIQKRPHPDFLFLEPQKTEIEIGEIRELIDRLGLKPAISSFKVALIDKAHCLNFEAQNCFLKTLEEPKGKAILILISEHPEMLLPTIVSRCEIIKFYPVGKTEIEKYLTNQGTLKDKWQELSEVSAGSPGRAIDFLNDNQKLEKEKKFIKDLIKISNSHLTERFQYVKGLTDREENIKEILDSWLRYFRELLLAKMNYSIQRETLMSKKYSLLKLKNILKVIQNITFQISRTNVNQKLALEMLMLEL